MEPDLRAHLKKLTPLFVSGVLLFALVQVVAAQAQERKEAAADKVDKKIFDGYVGRYQMAPNFILNITRDGDHLLAQATGQGAFEIFPESDKEFFAKGPALQISFTTDASGQPTEIVVHQRGRNTSATRLE